MKLLTLKDYPTIDDVKSAYPSAYAIEVIWDGWAVFLDYSQWITWKN